MSKKIYHSIYICIATCGVSEHEGVCVPEYIHTHTIAIEINVNGVVNLSLLPLCDNNESNLWSLLLLQII